MAEETPTPEVPTATPAADTFAAPSGDPQVAQDATELVSLAADPIPDQELHSPAATEEVAADDVPAPPETLADELPTPREEEPTTLIHEEEQLKESFAEQSQEEPAEEAVRHLHAVSDVADALSDTPLAADEIEIAEEEPEAALEPEPEEQLAPPENKKKWYVVKVQSNREDTIKEAIERRVKKEALEEFYGQIVIPVEKYTEVKQDKNGRKVTRTKERKLYPGYLFVEAEYNDRVLYLFRETSGVGDFVGMHPTDRERPPTPMSDVEVLRMIGPVQKADEPSPVPQPPPGLAVGDRVKVVDGTFNGMEGVVKRILEATGKLEVEVSIIGRLTQIELDYYQVEEI